MPASVGWPVYTHIHTHTRAFNGPLFGSTRVSRYQKCKTSLDLPKQETVSGSGIIWAICKSAPCSRQITMPAPHHSDFYRPDALPAAHPAASNHWRHWLTCIMAIKWWWWFIYMHCSMCSVLFLLFHFSSCFADEFFVCYTHVLLNFSCWLIQLSVCTCMFFHEVCLWSILYWQCLHSMQSRVCAAVGRPSAVFSIRPPHATAVVGQGQEILIDHGGHWAPQQHGSR